MPKKIVFVQGSPRKNGNTRAMVALAMEAAREQKAEVAEIDATGLEFKVPGCTGCQKCQRSEAFVCTIGDPLAKAVATLPEYDVIVMTTPLYWWSYPAQLKIFIDRMYSLAKFMEPEDSVLRLPGRQWRSWPPQAGPWKTTSISWKNSCGMRWRCSGVRSVHACFRTRPRKAVRS